MIHTVHRPRLDTVPRTKLDSAQSPKELTLDFNPFLIINNKTVSTATLQRESDTLIKKT